MSLLVTRGYGPGGTISDIVTAGYSLSEIIPPEGDTMSSIDFHNYVDIDSGVGGAASLGPRELILRIFSNNSLLSPGSDYRFTSSDDVGNFFGFQSPEYLRCKFYFGWISTRIKRAKKISFCRYTPGAIAPRIYGGKITNSIATLQTITGGLLTITTPTTPAGVALNGGDFSAAGSYAAMCVVLQNMLRGSADPMLSTATVTYDAPTGRAIIVFSSVGAGTVSILQAGAGATDVAAMFNLYAPAAMTTAGSDAQTPDSALSLMNGVSTNYGSMLFLPSLTVDQITAAATYNATQNNMYMFLVAATPANAAAINAALLNIPGVTATLIDPTDASDYAEMVPGVQLAATDYSTTTPATSNYMFKVFDLDPTVTDDTNYALYNSLRINFYGQTQIDGQLRQFYQPGVMFGPSTAPQMQNIYNNEMWLKSDITTGFFNALLALAEISANASGTITCRNVLQTSINKAVNNHVISVGKILTDLQIAYITEQSGDDKAWRKVQNIGYWYDVQIVVLPDDGSGITKYAAQYVLIYSKDDVIQKVLGSNILI